MNVSNIEAALDILRSLDLPRGQLNRRSALTLLALARIEPDANFQATSAPLVGITPIMNWIEASYGIGYAPNTRETFRRQTMHQFLSAGLVRYNPDNPARPVNSPAAVYQLTPEAVTLLRSFGTGQWSSALAEFLEKMGGLAQRYAKTREMKMVAVQIPGSRTIRLSPGVHSQLIQAIIEDFAPRFVPGSRLVYVGDTGAKAGFFDEEYLAELGVKVDRHGKLPDVVLHDAIRSWLVLVESVTSHGPVDAKRQAELLDLFKPAAAGLVYVTAFPDRPTMSRYLAEVAWESEVWIADAPSHLIHFNGSRFLGPYSS